MLKQCCEMSGICPSSIKSIQNLSNDFYYFLHSRILNRFYSEGGQMPGVPRRRRLPWFRTFPSFVFFVTALLPFLVTKWGRSAYWKMWLVSSLGTVSYMMLLFGKV